MAVQETVEGAVDAFIARWRNAGGSERANYQLFLTELCELLALPKPDPASEDTEQNAYVFERRVDIAHADGTTTRGYIDLYKRDCFVLEAKQTGQDLATQGWDKAMLRAQAQADTYARALPVTEGRPPFIVVTDVGRSLEIYAEFSRSGATYVPFPDPRSHRIKLDDLRDPAIRDRLTKVWTDAAALDPAKKSALVTREIAAKLATLARTLEEAGHHPEVVASFLMRCLFTMFAEDVELLPKNGFKELLEKVKNTPQHFVPLLHGLWTTMNKGGFSPELMTQLLRFNGGLFADTRVLPLERHQIELLIEASKSDWQFVEPSIFGTLLERALNTDERHKLGAHYTPRAYVERLVLPTIIEPLREEWRDVQAAALTLERQGKHAKAVDEIRAYHRRLCEVKVLDPACGTGNFLYVTLEHMKRLEGEILNTLQDLGETAMLEMGGNTVDPHQFLGLEINPRAAAIAEMVLWIGYLQWHFRTHGHVNPPEPVLRNFHNIENRDALIGYDNIEFVKDEKGRPVCRWDGKTFKKHPVTGEDVPDESAVRPLENYVNHRRAVWPQADFVVGNPPFIGNKRMRIALGDGYVDALRRVWETVPDTSDFVMYWWDMAAELVRSKNLRRFGLITTNSLKQVFNRKVIEHHLLDKKPLCISFAIPDHPWVDSSNGASVRIAMTVGSLPGEVGRLCEVTAERIVSEEDFEVSLETRFGEIHADLSIGPAVSRVKPLEANSNLCFQGMNLVGKGFRVSAEDVVKLGYDLDRLPEVIKPHFNARDLMQNGEPCWVIDLFGLTAEEARSQHPTLYNWLLVRVKPERDQNNDPARKRDWWLFGRSNRELRKASVNLSKIILTPETAKHRVFVFQDLPFCPDHKLYAVTTSSSFVLGVLSSRVHVRWALAAGGTLEDRPTWTNTTCFLPYPFPDLRSNEKRIGEIAASIDAHRKRQQRTYPELTLTGMYNVLEKIRDGRDLSVKEKLVHDQGLISVLKELHDELDREVLAAYGWEDLANALVGRPGATTTFSGKNSEQEKAEEEMLTRLVALNSARVVQESNREIQWLRPEYQAPQEAEQIQTGLKVGTSSVAALAPSESVKENWPKSLPQQVRGVRQHLSQAPLTCEALADLYKRKPVVSVDAVLGALEELGMVRRLPTGQYQLAA